MSPALMQVRMVKQAELEARIKEILAAADGVDADIAGVLTGSSSAGASAPKGSGEVGRVPTAADAERMAEALMDGEITKEDIDTLREQLDHAGVASIMQVNESGQLPAGAIEYLSTLYGSIPLDAWLQIQGELQNGNANAVLAMGELHNGVLAVSNESVVDGSGRRGGLSNLPKFAQQILNGEAITDVPEGLSEQMYWDKALSDPNSVERVALDNAYLGQIRGLGVPGGEFVNKLLGVNSRHAGLSTTIFQDSRLEAVPNGAYRGHAELYDSALSVFTGQDFNGPTGTVVMDTPVSADKVSIGIQELANRNPMAIGEFLAGDPVQVREVMEPLFRQEWADDGAALGRSLNWIDDAFTGDTPDPSPEAVEISNRAALGLATFLSDTDVAYELMDMGPDDRSANIGEVNPHLVRASLEALTPQFPNMLGLEVSDPVWFTKDANGVIHSHFEPGDVPVRMGNLSMLFQSEDESGNSFRHHMDALERNLYIGTEGAGSGGAGEIYAIKEFGTDAVQIEMANDRGAQEQFDFDGKSEWADAVTFGTNKLIGKLPLPGFIGDPLSGEVDERLTGAIAGDDPNWQADVIDNRDDEVSIKDRGIVLAVEAEIKRQPLSNEEKSIFSDFMEGEELSYANIDHSAFQTAANKFLIGRGATLQSGAYYDSATATFDGLANDFNKNIE